MHIKTVEVKTFKRILTCATTSCPGNYEFAGEVNVIPQTGSELPAKPIFKHVCSRCGDEQNFEQKFPQLIYEEIPVNGEEVTEGKPHVG